MSCIWLYNDVCFNFCDLGNRMLLNVFRTSVLEERTAIIFRSHRLRLSWCWRQQDIPNRRYLYISIQHMISQKFRSSPDTAVRIIQPAGLFKLEIMTSDVQYDGLITKYWDTLGLCALSAKWECFYYFFFVRVNSDFFVNLHQDGVGCITSRLRTGRFGVRMLAGEKMIFSSPKRPDRIWSPPTLLFSN
jgi:hypothetical protein